MALKKNIPSGIGIDTTYHVIEAIHIYPNTPRGNTGLPANGEPVGAFTGIAGIPTPTVHLDISSYISKDTYDAGGAPLNIRQIELAGDGYPFADGTMTLDELYNALLTTETFSGAEKI